FIYGRALTGGEIATLFNPNHNVLPTATAVALSASGATLDLNGVNQTIDSLTGGVGTSVLLGAGTLTLAGNLADSTFSGAISGAGNLVKAGPRTLSLSGNN